MAKIRNEEYLKAFGLHLRKLRMKKGVSQEQLANDADVPLSQIGRIERGEINPTINTVFYISQALNLDPKDLLDF